MIVAARSNWELNYDNKARKAAIFFFFFSYIKSCGLSLIDTAKWHKTRARIVSVNRRHNGVFCEMFFYLPHIQFILR